MIYKARYKWVCSREKCYRRVRTPSEGACTITIEEIKYGALYNLYAVENEKNICAAGWHVSTEVEHTGLYTFLDGGVDGGGKLKEVGTVYWDNPNNYATNSTKFNGRAGGWRNYDGTFTYKGEYFICHALSAGSFSYMSLKHDVGDITIGGYPLVFNPEYSNQ